MLLAVKKSQKLPWTLVPGLLIDLFYTSVDPGHGPKAVCSVERISLP